MSSQNKKVANVANKLTRYVNKPNVQVKKSSFVDHIHTLITLLQMRLYKQKRTWITNKETAKHCLVQQMAYITKELMPGHTR